jgi:potassium-transporting ATPase KdpC subunit
MKLMLRPVLLLFVLLSLLTGLVYPLLITGIGKLAFPRQASGSLIMQGGKLVGASLISQSFQDPKYFWGRLSATSPMPNNASASNGSNFGPTNPALIEAVKARIDALRKADPDNTLPIPVDLVTSSGSGLDPDITPAAALYQVARVARVRHLDPVKLKELVISQVKGPQWGIFGETRVNVLMLNLSVDEAR